MWRMHFGSLYCSSGFVFCDVGWILWKLFYFVLVGIVQCLLCYHSLIARAACSRFLILHMWRVYFGSPCCSRHLVWFCILWSRSTTLDSLGIILVCFSRYCIIFVILSLINRLWRVFAHCKSLKKKKPSSLFVSMVGWQKLRVPSSWTN